MVFPDRTPHPAMEELKFLQRPVTFRVTGLGDERTLSEGGSAGVEAAAVDLESWDSNSAHVVVRNWLNFAELDGMTTSWYGGAGRNPYLHGISTE